MANEVVQDPLQEKFNLLLRVSEDIKGLEDYGRLSDVFQNIFRDLSNAEKCEINTSFLQSVDNLMTNAGQWFHRSGTQPDGSAAPVITCITNCLRVCRNLCALCKANQAILHDSQTFIQHLLNFLSDLQSCDTLNEELLVLFRCAVQFLCNYASGNMKNQLHIWTLFQPFFLYCLNAQDAKLQNYAQMGVHICLSGEPYPIHKMSNSSLCWEILQKCVHLAEKDEAVNGLLVIEDSLKLPDFCENVFPGLENQLKILVLEVLINQLQQIVDTGEHDSSHPSMSNIRYLASDFVVQSHRLPHMGRESLDDSTALYLVKELEGLCLASAHHSVYPCLQETEQLVKVSIGTALLECIEGLGQDGNHVFADVGKMSQLDSVNHDHPVFGLKRDLIRLLGNLAYKHRANQDLIREQNGIPLILNKTNIDGKNPFIIQWSVLAIRNLTEENVENQQYISDLKLEGVANNQAVLDEMGLTAEREGEKVVIKKKRVE